MELTTVRQQDWYAHLVEEIQSIAVERSYNSRIEVITGKWEIGRLLSENSSYRRFERQEGFINQFASDIGCSPSNIYQCLAFYGRFPNLSDLELLPEGKNISWYRITQQYLNSGGEEVAPRTRNTFKVEQIVSAFKSWNRTRIDSPTDEDIEGFTQEFLHILRDGN